MFNENISMEDDGGLNNFNFTYNSAQLSQDRFGNSNSAYSFENDKIVIDHDIFNIGEDFTISVWLTLSNINAISQTIYNTTNHHAIGLSYHHASTYPSPWDLAGMCLFVGNASNWSTINTNVTLGGATNWCSISGDEVIEFGDPPV